MQRSSLHSTGRQDMVALTGGGGGLAFTGEPGSSYQGCVPVVFMGHRPLLAGGKRRERKKGPDWSTTLKGLQLQNLPSREGTSHVVRARFLHHPP